jgi:hypothetical protein
VSTSLEMARFLPALRGAPRELRAHTRPAFPADMPHGVAWVLEMPPGDAPPAHTRRTRLLRFPGTGGGWVLLDADVPRVFRAGASLLPRGRFWTRLASDLVRLGSHVGLGQRLALGELTLVEHAHAPERALRERFAGLPPDLRCNIASGVPGRDQKTIVQLATRAGEVVAYAKLAHAPSARALVRAEAATLVQLRELGVHAPELLGVEAGDEHVLLVQRAVRGTRSPGVLGSAHAQYLAHLEFATRREVPFDALPSHQETLARLGRLAAHAQRAWLAAYAALAAELRVHAGPTPIVAALAHGDFTPWNIAVERGVACAFDWEHARPLAPRGHDAFHFALQQAVLVERVPDARLLEHVLAAARPAALHATRDEAELALGLYLLDAGSADEERQLEQRSPFPQVDWLRDARLALVQALLARLRARARTPPSLFADLPGGRPTPTERAA